MRTTLVDRCVLVVWGLLLLALPVGWLISSSVSRSPGASAAALADVSVLLIAVLKARFIAFYFMDIRGAPVLLRTVADGYFVLTGLSMVTVYLS